jgi:hypothetical protein
MGVVYSGGRDPAFGGRQPSRGHTRGRDCGSHGGKRGCARHRSRRLVRAGGGRSGRRTGPGGRDGEALHRGSAAASGSDAGGGQERRPWQAAGGGPCAEGIRQQPRCLSPERAEPRARAAGPGTFDAWRQGETGSARARAHACLCGAAGTAPGPRQPEENSVLSWLAVRIEWVRVVWLARLETVT